MNKHLFKVKGQTLIIPSDNSKTQTSELSNNVGRSRQGKAVTLEIAEHERGQSSPTSSPFKALYIQLTTKGSSFCLCGTTQTQLQSLIFWKPTCPSHSG